MSRPKCHRSVISLKYFFAVLQSRLHKEFWLLYILSRIHWQHSWIWYWKLTTSTDLLVDSRGLHKRRVETQIHVLHSVRVLHTTQCINRRQLLDNWFRVRHNDIPRPLPMIHVDQWQSHSSTACGNSLSVALYVTVRMTLVHSDKLRQIEIHVKAYVPIHWRSSGLLAVVLEPSHWTCIMGVKIVAN